MRKQKFVENGVFLSHRARESRTEIWGGGGGGGVKAKENLVVVTVCY